MKFDNLLATRKQLLTEQWFKRVVLSYPADAGKYLGDDTKQFGNPVGFIISKELSVILDELTKEKFSEAIIPSIENIIRIRAVQDFKPSEATAFIHYIKDITRNEFKEYLTNDEFLSDYFEFCVKVDYVSGLALNFYMEAREKLWEIKTNELKARTYVLLEKIGKKKEQ